MAIDSNDRNERPANADEINNIISHLLQMTDNESRPHHISALWHVLKDIEAIKLNIKFFGYDLLSRAARALPVRKNLTPTKIDLECKPSTQEDIESYWLAVWAGELQLPVVYVRKLWEFAFVLQAIYEHGFLTANSRGIGFGCGIEPIPSYLASKGVKVTITDAPPENQVSEGWAKTNQHTSDIDKAFYKNLVTADQFRDHVDFKFVDMNHINTDCRDYDFCWSICALEHLGSIEKGMNFIENSLDTLRPNGLSVHTTEFNFLHDDWTVDNWGTVYPQRKHFQALAERLRAKGHWVAPLDFDYGKGPIDKFIDMPPFAFNYPEPQQSMWADSNSHMKVFSDGVATTCFGVIVRKAV